MRGLDGLSKAERQMACDALTEDFVALGRGPNDEPNLRGRIIEDVIDFVARLDSVDETA